MLNDDQYKFHELLLLELELISTSESRVHPRFVSVLGSRSDAQSPVSTAISIIFIATANRFPASPARRGHGIAFLSELCTAKRE